MKLSEHELELHNRLKEFNKNFIAAVPSSSHGIRSDLVS